MGDESVVSSRGDARLDVLVGRKQRALFVGGLDFGQDSAATASSARLRASHSASSLLPWDELVMLDTTPEDDVFKIFNANGVVKQTTHHLHMLALHMRP